MATTNIQLAEHVWMQHASRINLGLIDTVVLDPVVEEALGSRGLALIVERFQSMIQAPVEIIKHELYLTEISPVIDRKGHKNVAVTESKVDAKAKSKKDKIARPPNAFILYRQHHHPLVKAQYPNLHNNQISIILGKQWQNETADIKGQWKSLAEEIKKKHLNAHPNYQYQPRKPSEKKRRMTRRKAEKLSAEAVKFDKTSTGNAVFTLGDNSIDDATLLAMLQNHNHDVMGRPHNNTAAPVLFHERSEEAQNDANFYANMINIERMCPVQPDANSLLPMDEKALATVQATNYKTLEQYWDVKCEERQNAEVHRQEAELARQKAESSRQLSQFSTLWPSSSSNEETPSFENGF
ncbi:MAG: hypothetical protein Q9223_007801 [Gallowayella weberi]